MFRLVACLLLLLSPLAACDKDPTAPLVEPVRPPSPPLVPQPHFGELSTSVRVTGDADIVPMGFEIWLDDVPFFAVAPNVIKTIVIAAGTYDVRLGPEAAPNDDDLYGFACWIIRCQYEPFQNPACKPQGPLSHQVTVNEGSNQTVIFDVHCEKRDG